MRCVQIHTQEIPPTMPRIRATDGSDLAWSDDSDLVLTPTTLPEIRHIRLRSPHKPDHTLAAGHDADMRALIPRLREAIVAASESAGDDIVDVAALLGVTP